MEGVRIDTKPDVHLRFCMLTYRSGKHPIDQMSDLGISYIGATSQPIGDQWVFWSCKNVPIQLPDYLDIFSGSYRPNNIK